MASTTATASQPPSAPRAEAAKAANMTKTATRSLFPPIPAPLQRLFDLVPLVTYPPNALPGLVDGDQETCSSASASIRLPTLYVFSSPQDADRGLPSFNPTCLKWQTFLRIAGVSVRLQPSSNHASPTGALPFLLLPTPESTTSTSTSTSNLTTPSPARLICAHEIESYARSASTSASISTPTSSSSSSPSSLLPYQALLDTRIRRAWLHAVYLHLSPSGSPSSSTSIATRLYVHPASSSPLVRATLARQLHAAAAAEVWGQPQAGADSDTDDATCAIYRDAERALQALATLLSCQDGESPTGEAGLPSPFFSAALEPGLFDAAVFSYTHLLLQDLSSPAPCFAWHDRTLPDAVGRLPALVQHHQAMLAYCWPELAATSSPSSSSSSFPEKPPGVADSVVWVEA